MKSLLILLFVVFGFASSAQKPTENSIVKDSSGTVYPAAIWKALLMKGGHVIRAENKDDPNTAFYLVRLTQEEKEARLAKVPAPKESKFFKNGEKFNLGKMSDIKGNKIDLKDNKGKITVVNFWFINCPPCRMEIPDLNELVTKYASDSVRFVAIALDDKYSLEDFLRTMPFNYHIVDDGRSLAQQYGVQSYPTHVVIDQESKVYFHTTGLSINTVYWLDKCIRELKNKAAQTSTASTQ
ncbi:MAG: TlpA family protein disulfide reductase [Chitinophagaceae bacterium]|nr:MAG: TlpA family protein disulfide reductase [Chitinophagaceae bacterium]